MDNTLHSLLSNSSEPKKTVNPRHRNLLSSGAKLFPVLLLCAFAVCTWVLFGEQLTPAKQYAVTRVITVRALHPAANHAASQSKQPDVDPYAAPTLFQASGWFEPDPFPVRVSTLYSGVVKNVFVLDGEHVEQGQLLATMIAEDAELDLQTAQSIWQERLAQLKQSKAAKEEAQARLTTWKLRRAVAKKRANELQDDAERLTQAGSTIVPEREISQALLKLATQQANIEMLEAEKQELLAILAAREADVDIAEQRANHAQTDLERKQLALDRTRITSPVDGIIQHLYVGPGSKRMLHMDHPDSATIATLYQPSSLQARIDVPLEEVARLFIDQAVILKSSLLPEQSFRGRVTSIVGKADIQRNTLQVKVALTTPHPILRPDMLCRAEFLAPTQITHKRTADPSDTHIAIYAPKTAIFQQADTHAVWVLDDTRERVDLRTIQLGSATKGDYIHIRTGLLPGDLIVREPDPDLLAGQKIQPVYNYEQ